MTRKLVVAAPDRKHAAERLAREFADLLLDMRQGDRLTIRATTDSSAAGGDWEWEMEERADA